MTNSSFEHFINENSETKRLHMVIKGKIHDLFVSTHLAANLKQYSFLTPIRYMTGITNGVSSMEVLVVAIRKVTNEKYSFSLRTQESQVGGREYIADSAVLQKTRHASKMRAFNYMLYCKILKYSRFRYFLLTIKRLLGLPFEKVPTELEIALFVAMNATQRFNNLKRYVGNDSATGRKRDVYFTEIMFPEDENPEGIQWMVIW